MARVAAAVTVAGMLVGQCCYSDGYGGGYVYGRGEGVRGGREAGMATLAVRAIISAE